MKNIFKNIITYRKDDLITFNIFLAVIVTAILFLIFKNIEETRFTTLLAIALWLILIIGINYLLRKIAKKYIVDIPDEIDQQIDSCLLITTKNEVFKMDENWIWSPGGKIYKVESNPPEKSGKWIIPCQKNKTGPSETSYLFSMTVGEIIFEEYREEIFIQLFMEEKFNPLEIYDIYKKNDLKIIDNRLYVEDALKAAIKKINEDYIEFKNQVTINEYFIKSFIDNLKIPNFSGVKNYAIYRKKEYPA